MRRSILPPKTNGNRKAWTFVSRSNTECKSAPVITGRRAPASCQRTTIDRVAQPQFRWRRDMAVLLDAELVFVVRAVGVFRWMRHFEPVRVGQCEFDVPMHCEIEHGAP